jgi:hypothetical protein
MLLARAGTLVAMPAILAAAPVLTASTAEAAKGDYTRRRNRHRTGLLLKDVKGDADYFNRLNRKRDGSFEGDILVQRFDFYRKLTVAGVIDGEVEIERRRGDKSIDINYQLFRTGADLDVGGRHDDLTLDIGKIRLPKLDVVIDPNAVDLDRIWGTNADRLEKLLKKLAEALEDDRHRKPDFRDVDELVDKINKLLAKFLFVVNAGRGHKAA